MSTSTSSDEPVFLYVIHCLDDQTCGMIDKGARFGGSVKRLEVYAEHKLWQGETSSPTSPHYIKKISAGPMESDDGKFMIGSMFIVEATRSAAEAFIHNDIFFKTGVWASVSINRYISIPNGIQRVHVHKDGDDMTSIKMIVADV